MGKSLSKYKNFLDLKYSYEPNERREELCRLPLHNNTPFPLPVTLEDIDESMKEWVDKTLEITFEDKKIPTVQLFSNQRFSEYQQTWSLTDENKNVLLNFKSINRELKTSEGKNQGGIYNIPGEPYFLMARKEVLDNNGTTSFIDYKMKQPMSLNLTYTISLFTNKLPLVNDFDIKIKDQFKACQSYIVPRGHYMPLKIESSADKSEYNTDNRRFYSTSYDVTVAAYIIQESDFLTQEVPSKMLLQIDSTFVKKNKAEITDSEEWICNNKKEYYNPFQLLINFDACPLYKLKFTMDTDMNIFEGYTENVKWFKINDTLINLDNISESSTLNLKQDEIINIEIRKLILNKESIIRLNGYNPNEVYDYDPSLKNNPID